MLLHNFKASGVYGISVVVNEVLAIPKFAEDGEKVLPTAFMPPLYFYFVYFCDLLSNKFLNTISIVIFFQIILSLLSIFIFFKIIKILENNIFLIFLYTLILAFFPIYVYASGQNSSIILQIFLLLNFLFFLLKLEKNKIKHLIIFSFFSGLLMLTRGEFFIFYFFTILYFFFFLKKNMKYFLISIIISLLVISPYLYRNYKNFQTITITKSFGYNLLKGNNLNFKVEGDNSLIETNFFRISNKIKTNNQYDIILDNLYKERAFNTIKNNPIEYFKFYLKKIFSFLFFDVNSSYGKYYHAFHFYPKVIIAVLSFVGGIINLRKKGFNQFLALFYFGNIFLFSIFFILPRYSLILLPVQIILSMSIIKFLTRKLFN